MRSSVSWPIRHVLPIVRLDGRVFARSGEPVFCDGSELDAFEVTGLVSDDATSALIDDAGIEGVRLGDECTAGAIRSAPGAGQELRRVKLLAEVRFSIV
jgi:hypothetical protein